MSIHPTKSLYASEVELEQFQYELDEIDAQIDELQALVTAQAMATGADAADLYEEEMLELKEDIGALRDKLEHALEEMATQGKTAPLSSRMQEGLYKVRSMFDALRRQFVQTSGRLA
jgi:hypothetical protein